MSKALDLSVTNVKTAGERAHTGALYQRFPQLNVLLKGSLSLSYFCPTFQFVA